MRKRWIKCALLGTILGVILSFTVAQYQSDNYDINLRIAQLQRQQEMLTIGDVNPLPVLAKRAMLSVVYVEAPGMWSGSGVIIGPHTVLTAKHVIEGSSDLTIETSDGKVHEVINWVTDEDNDCGLLFFDPREKFENISEFANSDLLQIGDNVFAIGSPFGKQLYNTLTFGVISGLNRDIPFFGKCGMVTSDAAINPGNSGGPVFDMQGKIIGIAVGRKWGSDGLNIITSSNTCKDLLESKEKVEIENTKTDEAAGTS